MTSKRFLVATMVFALLTTGRPASANEAACPRRLAGLGRTGRILAVSGRALFPPLALPIDTLLSALALHREGRDSDLWKSPLLALRRNVIPLILYGLLQSAALAFTYGNLPAPDTWDQANQGPPPLPVLPGPGAAPVSIVLQNLLAGASSIEDAKKRVREALQSEGVTLFDEAGNAVSPDVIFENKTFYLHTANNHGKALRIRVQVLPGTADRAEIWITALNEEGTELGQTKLALNPRQTAEWERESARLNDFVHSARILPEGYVIQDGKSGKAETKFRMQIWFLSKVTKTGDLADKRRDNPGWRLLFGSHSMIGAGLDLGKGVTHWKWNNMSRIAKPIAEPQGEVNDRILARGAPDGFADGARITENVAPDEGYRQYYVRNMLPITVGLHNMNGAPLKLVENDGQPAFTLQENLAPSPYSQFYRKFSGTKGMNIRLDEANFYAYADGPDQQRHYYRGKVLVYSSDVILNRKLNMRPHFWVYTGPSGKNYFVKFADWAGVSENGLAHVPLNLVEVPKSAVPGAK